MAALPQVSFGKGEISPISAARTDLQSYASALLTCQNFFVHVEGGASNRPGLQWLGPSLTNVPYASVILPFVYNNVQTYVVEFAPGAIQFFSNGAFVQNAVSPNITNVTVSNSGSQCTVTYTAANSLAAGQTVTISGVVGTGSLSPNGTFTISSATGTSFKVVIPGNFTFTYTSGGAYTQPFVISNPYVAADMPNLRWAQSADVLNVVVATQPLQQLKRITPTVFSLLAPTLLFGPLQDFNTDGTTYVYTSGTTGTVDIFASGPIFKTAHVGALFAIQEQFLAALPEWEAQKVLINAASPTPVGMYIRSDNKIYKCVAAAVASTRTATGTFQPVHTFGTQMDGDGGSVPNFADVCGVAWQFVSDGTGIAQITQFFSSTHVKAVVQTDKGQASNFSPTVVGAPVTKFGPFTFNGDGVTVTFTPLTAITTGDPSQFLVTVGGVFQDPSLYTISQSGTSITFFTAPPTGTGNVVVTQVAGALSTIYTDSVAAPLNLRGIPLSTYWAFGSLSAVQGYASEVSFFGDRFVLAGSLLQPQTLWASVTGDYLNFRFSTPQVDSDTINETINARQQNPINNLLPMNNLLLGTASASWRATGSNAIGTISPNDIALIPQEFYGMQPVPAVQTGTTVIYVQWGGRKIRDIIFNFYTDKFQGHELTSQARHIFPFGTTCIRAAFAPEPYGLLYCVRSDGVLCVCTYLPEQQVEAWSRWVTTGVFEDVCVVPENGAFGVYVIVGRTVNGAYVRSIERFAPREFFSSSTAFFVDGGVTVNNILPVSTVKGAPVIANRTDVSALLDGVPVRNLTADANGIVNLPIPASVVVLGMPYTAQLQSLPFNQQGQETIRNKSKTIPSGSLIVDQSYPFQTGPDFVNLTDQVWPTAAPTPFTGLVPVKLITEPTEDAALCVQVVDPVPVRLLSWIPDVVIGDVA